MAPISLARCPTCKETVPAEPADRPPDFPFCSERCRLVDLYHWLAGDYRVPLKDAPSDTGEEEA
ncbi:MAG: DNA gyrase inhibitor YacG [Planctomycetaceae bacterium]